MGLFFHAEFQPRLAGADVSSLGECLYFNLDTLEDIAEAAELTPLSQYGDCRPVPEGFEGGLDDLKEVMGEWSEWFDPVDGIIVVQALVDCIESNPYARSQLREPDWVLKDLNEVIRILFVAQKEGAQFRFQLL